MAFKMKNPSIMKMAKMAGSPMKKTYKEAYEGLSEDQKKKYKGYDDFLDQAKEYNRRKYGTTEPTKAAKKAGITKKELADRRKPTRKVETKKASATLSAPSKIEIDGAPMQPSRHDKMMAAKKEGGRTARKVKAAERKLRKAAGDNSARGQRKRRKAEKKLRKAGIL